MVGPAGQPTIDGEAQQRDRCCDHAAQRICTVGCHVVCRIHGVGDHRDFEFDSIAPGLRRYGRVDEFRRPVRRTQPRSVAVEQVDDPLREP